MEVMSGVLGFSGCTSFVCRSLMIEENAAHTGDYKQVAESHRKVAERSLGGHILLQNSYRVITGGYSRSKLVLLVRNKQIKIDKKSPNHMSSHQLP